MNESDVIIRLRVDGQEQAAQAFQRTGEAARRNMATVEGATSSASRELGRFVTETTRANRTFNLGAVQNASFQISDFAVQVAGGTSALRAASQQVPQLLGAFGPWGAIVGGAAAVAGALATGLLGVGDQADAAASRTDALADSIGALRGAAVTGAESLSGLIEQYGVLDAQLVTLIQRQTEFNRLAAQRDASEALSGVGRAAADLFDDQVAPGASRLARGEGAALDDRARRILLLRELALDAQNATTFDAQSAAVERLGAALDGLVGPESSESLRQFAELVNNTQLTVREFQRAEIEAAQSAELLARPLSELRRLAEDAARPSLRASGAGRGARSRAGELPDEPFANGVPFPASRAASGRFDPPTLEELGLTLDDVSLKVRQGEEAFIDFGAAASRAFDTAIQRARSLSDVGAIVLETFAGFGLQVARDSFSPLVGAAAGGLTNFLTGQIGGLFASSPLPTPRPFGIGGAAFGGVFAAPGGGGADTVTAMMRVSPGEPIAFGAAARGQSFAPTFNFYGVDGARLEADPSAVMRPATAELEMMIARASQRGGRWA